MPPWVENIHLGLTVLRLSSVDVRNVPYFAFYSALWLFYYFCYDNVTNGLQSIN